ncbi:MAG TPA: chemotaxis protein CheW [Polyangiaceae bacterium]|jgi:chemotaxis signal transduction protein
MDEELVAFRGSDQEPEREENSRSFVHDLLLFEYAGTRYGLPAECVDSVVQWRTPVVIPGADARVRGVIQDRGRIVVVLAHPTGRGDGRGHEDGQRIIICTTPRGHIGIPASTASTVGQVETATTIAEFALHESSEGSFVYLNPLRHAQ